MKASIQANAKAMHAVSVARSASAAHNCPQAFHDKALVVRSEDSHDGSMLAFKHAVTT
jgi:hypothetical protein